MQSVYDDDGVVKSLTEKVIAAGHRIFQIYKLGDTDKQHVAVLLDHFKPPHGARVLDAGCGVGEMASLMKEARPDLEFVLLNISPSQLDMCPGGMKKLCASAEKVPCEDGEFDAISLCYVLGHLDLDRMMQETARILKPEGILFIYDMTAYPDYNCLVAPLQYQLHYPARVWSAGKQNGFILDKMANPDANTRDFMKVMPPDEFKDIFATVRPIIYRFVKC